MTKFKLILLCVISITSNLSYSDTLYKPETYRSLTSDRRAYRVGDLLTVLIVENSSASASSGTNTDKSNDAGLKFSTPQDQKNYSLGLKESFDGRGKIARTGKLLAQLSVSVKEVNPNGDLTITGNQQIEINDEKQSINIMGRVRSIDIDEKNTVLSTRISDAKITYLGDGVLADSQHKGWLSRIITLLGLL